MAQKKAFLIGLLSCILLIIGANLARQTTAGSIFGSSAYAQEPPAAAPVLQEQGESAVPPAPAPDRSADVAPSLSPAPNSNPSAIPPAGYGGGVPPAGYSGGVPPFGPRPGAMPYSSADPYGTPQSTYWQDPQGPYRNSPYGYQQTPPYGEQPGMGPEGEKWKPIRLLDHLQFGVLWMKGGSDSRNLGLTQVDLNITLNWLGCLAPGNEIRITPGFSFYWWKMSENSALYFPDETYDAYVSIGWTPKVHDNFFADLELKMGAFSDFKSVKGEMFRLSGHALGGYKMNDRVSLLLGVDYVNRVNTKLLPAGGISWKSSDLNWEVYAVFPNPKVRKRCTLIDSGGQFWWYVEGEYGGGTWTIQSQMPGMSNDVVSYNDIRLSVGMELEFYNHITGYFEIGGAFNRELEYKRTGSGPSPADSFFLEGGLRF